MTPHVSQPADPVEASSGISSSASGKATSWIGAVLKVAVAVLLIGWMIRTGRLNVASLAGAFRNKHLLLGAAALFYGQIAVTGVRWYLLLRSQGFCLPLRDTLALNMIGMLFNTVIPGAVGGDVIKGYYLSRRAGTRRTTAVTTLLIDRVIGVLGLLMLSLIAALWNTDLIARSHPIQVLLLVAGASLGAGIGGFIAALLFGNRLLAVIEPLTNRFRPVLIFRKILLAVIQYQHHAGVIFASVLISIINHLMGTGAFFLCALALGNVNVEPSRFLLVVPLGLITTAVPISPAGVGIGQAAFFTLFALLPGMSGRVGSEACTVFQVVTIAVYLTGFLVYVFYREQPEPVTAIS